MRFYGDMINGIVRYVGFLGFGYSGTIKLGFTVFTVASYRGDLHNKYSDRQGDPKLMYHTYNNIASF